MKNLQLPGVMYISLDGMMEPLGYSQVLKYLEKLSSNYKITLVSFEKFHDLANSEALKLLIHDCSKHEIDWVRLKYRSGYMGLGQFVNIVSLICLPIYIFLRCNIKIVHIRSYMPGIGIPLLSALFNFKLIFDMRGFWADEKHDRLGWKKKSLKYRFFKQLESYLIRRSDSVITLTNVSKEIIYNVFKKNESKIKVIPTCVDSHEFTRKNHITDHTKIVIGYLGSVDTAYDFQKFLFFIKQIKIHTTISLELRILTNKNKKIIEEILIQNDIKNIDLVVKFVVREMLPSEISKFDFLGFCLKENYSINASMPTKIAEALACGVPIVCNAFNKDIKNLIEAEGIGFIHNFNSELKSQDCAALIKLIKDSATHKKCSKIAKKQFSLDSGVLRYRSIYSNLTS